MFDVKGTIIEYDRKPFAVLMVDPAINGGWVTSAIDQMREYECVSTHTVLEEMEKIESVVNQKLADMLAAAWISPTVAEDIKLVMRRSLNKALADAYDNMELYYE